MGQKIILGFTLALFSLSVCFGTPISNSRESEINEVTSKLILRDIPFSFKYGEDKSVKVLTSVKPKVKRENRDNEHTIIVVKEWTLNDGLTITQQTREYQDFPAIEWVVYLTNNGVEDSKEVSDLYPLDYKFKSITFDLLEVHTNKGDNCSATSYEPYSIKFKKKETETFQPTFGGKSTTGKRGWPYWNIQNGRTGLILALGWPGAWKCQMTKDNDTEFTIKAGQGTFSSYLKPGETIRTPLVCMVFWEDMNRDAAQNIWRRFYLTHVIPKFLDKPEQPATEIQITQTEAKKAYAQKFIDAGIKPRICWTDAGWYPTLTGDWLETGDWVMNPEVFPNGMKTFTNWAHGENMESLLWFEPERVHNGNNYLYNKHKDWLVQSCDKGFSTLNLGNKDCQNWLKEHIDSIIVTNGLDWYREDLNGSGPQCLWETLDSEGRKGIHENLYVQGHLALWDELKKRHPNLHIDACASGGRRNDLETMHRAVPLLRSDYQWAKYGEEYIRGNQAQTWALSAWFPYQGSAVYEYEPYKYRSFYLPCFGMGKLKETNISAYKQAYNECKAIQPMMLYGDYWPLTPYSIDKDKWIGWQFNREGEGDGCIQVFRREHCEDKLLTIKLKGLKKDAYYIITDNDKPEKKIIQGSLLMNTGFVVEILQNPGSALLTYKIIN